ncbi:MAG: hypothetical protein GY913_27815 [Proteobacteria bacterium]|nr:hypothetical protein [Pseudomonadota bacterium]
MAPTALDPVTLETLGEVPFVPGACAATRRPPGRARPHSGPGDRAPVVRARGRRGRGRPHVDRRAHLLPRHRARDLPDGRVQIDACCFEDLTFGNEFGFSPEGWDPVSAESNPVQKLMRWTLDPASGKAERVDIDPLVIDFPQWDGDEVIGAARSHERAFPFDSVGRLDASDPGRPPELFVSDGFMGEPLYAGERHVVACVYKATHTEVVVLERENLAAGPVAVVPGPLLPYGFHGLWVPST